MQMVIVCFWCHFSQLSGDFDILYPDCGACMATNGGSICEHLAQLLKSKKSCVLPLMQQLHSEDDG